MINDKMTQSCKILGVFPSNNDFIVKYKFGKYANSELDEIMRKYQGHRTKSRSQVFLLHVAWWNSV